MFILHNNFIVFSILVIEITRKGYFLFFAQGREKKDYYKIGDCYFIFK